MYVILLGAPGAGKGTQATTITQELGLGNVASGDLFRSVRERDTELGRLVRSYYDRGALVPDEVAIQLILDRLAQPDAARGALLDGFPRTLEQARALDAALAEQGKALDRVLFINVSTDELLKRLSGRWVCRRCQAPYHAVLSPPKVPGRCDLCGGELYQRPDDTPETVRKRIDVYFSQTAPLIEYYRRQGKLVEVNGEQPVEQVRHDALAALAAGRK
ncbi:MAG: adenylate kinase [Chloroflexi bacterium]|nr:adenylate kinase [Chloroflexota bacterium]